jgi:hypothetical protein
VFSHSSKGRLTRRDLGRFSSGSLFDRIARAVCEAGCLPRKELFEAWEVARRARRRFRGGRIIDAAGGHGLLAHVMLLLDDSSREAIVVDPAVPESAAKLHDALTAAWPRLAGRVNYLRADLGSVALRDSDVVVSSHACGELTDRVIDAAGAARARVAVLPCCHDLETCDAGPLTGWLDGAMAVDAMRAARLAARDYEVWTQTIPETITPKNRLLLAQPRTPPRQSGTTAT